MACACQGRSKQTYVWTSADGTETRPYETEIQSKAKVLRAGGSYITQG